MLDAPVKKPLVDPLCLCGEPHPCREHGRPEDVAPTLFEVEPVRVGS